jgi:hypothetical protein
VAGPDPTPPFGVDLWIIDVPLWLLIVAVVAIGLLLWWLSRDDEFDQHFPSDDDAARLAIPYYVEREGLGNLAASFKIDLPRTREVTKEHKLMARLQGVGGERGQSETRQFSDEVDLRRLTRTLDEKLDFEACARDLTNVPLVEDRQVLTDAIAHVNLNVPEKSETRELLRRVEEVYDTERAETIIKQKRDELREVGVRQKLVIIRGMFVTAERAEGEPQAIELTEFETPIYYRAPADGDEPTPMPVPQGVGIRVALPDDSAFTPAGKERFARGDPFYVQMIAHSPSFNEDSGVLSCAAYAVWGTNRPRPRPEYYGYGC